MSLFTKFIASLPLALTIAGFVLSTLSLSASHQENFMEEYVITRLNISGIGYGILHRDGDRDEDKDDNTGFLDSMNDAKDTVLDKMDDAIGDVTSSAMDKLNIPDWYSIHIMRFCYGSFKHNSTGDGASLNVTRCTKGADQFNLEAIVKKALTKISLPLDTESLGLSTVQKKLDIINKVLSGLLVVYIFGTLFGGISILTYLPALFLGRKAIINLETATMVLATVFLFLGSIIITITVAKGVGGINALGNEIGISAERGSKFLAISWAATCVMIVSTTTWITNISYI